MVSFIYLSSTWIFRAFPRRTVNYISVAAPLRIPRLQPVPSGIVADVRAVPGAVDAGAAGAAEVDGGRVAGRAGSGQVSLRERENTGALDSLYTYYVLLFFT